MPDALHMHKPYTDKVYPFWGVLMTATYGGFFYWGMDQVNVQRVLGARDLDQARWGAMFAALLKLTPAFIFALPGVIALALFPGRESRTTFVTILNEMLPTGIRGYVLSALVGAVISALIAVMNSISTMSVRDFLLRFRPETSDRAQVIWGRAAIAFAALLGCCAAWVVYIQPEGIFKYLLTINSYLVMPLTPAIAFGIMSKKVTFKGAAASVIVGLLLCSLFVIDALMPQARARSLFPILHTTFSENYAYRGVLGTAIITIVLFLVSAFTRKTSPEKLVGTTIDWNRKWEPYRGISDWRLHLAILSGITILAYWFMW
jgi:SSS family solute:Na+ symporter